MSILSKRFLLLTHAPSAAQSSSETYTLYAYGIFDKHGLLIRVLATVKFSGYDTSQDSDSDGVSDEQEAFWGSDPYDENDTVQVPLTTSVLAVILLALGAAVTWRI